MRGKTVLAANIAFLFIVQAAWGIFVPVADRAKQIRSDLSDSRVLANFGPFSYLAFSADGKWLVTSDTRTVTLWETATGKEVHAFRGHTDSVGVVAFSDDGKWLVTGSYDKTARLWDVATGKEIRSFHGHTSAVLWVALSADGLSLMTGGNEDKTARLWDVGTGKEVRVFKHDLNLSSVAFSKDGQRLVTVDTESAFGKYRLWDVATGKLIRSSAQAQVHWLVLSPAYSADAKLMVSASHLPKTLVLTDLATGQVTQAFETQKDNVFCVHMSADGRWLATASERKLEDHDAYLWDVKTGQRLRAFKGHTGPVVRVALNADGRWLATTSNDGTTRLWNLDQRK